MTVTIGFERNSTANDTLFIHDEDKGVVTLTVKREASGSTNNLNFFSYFKLDLHHLEGLTSSDYELLTLPQSDSYHNGFYYFGLNEDEFKIRVRLTDDSRDESDILEGLYFSISEVEKFGTLEGHVIASASHNNLSQSATLAILDDDEPSVSLPRVYVDNAGTVNEGDYANFTVRVEGDFTEPIEVELFTWKTSEANQGGNGTDYDGFVSKTITFQPNGSKTHTESIYIKPDSVSDDGETFELRIEQVSSNAEIGDYRGVATIRDVVPEAAPNPQPTIPLPDLAVASPNQVFPDDVSKKLVLESLSRLVNAVGTDQNLAGANHVATFGEYALDATTRVQLDKVWEGLRDSNMLVDGSMFTPDSVKLDRILDSAEHYNDFSNVTKFLGYIGDTATVFVAYDELSSDGSTSLNDWEILGNDTFNTIASASVTSMAMAGVVTLVGITPAGWGIVLIGATGVAVSFVSSEVLDWLDPVSGISNATSRPENFNPFLLIQQTLEKVGTEVFGDQYTSSTTTSGGSVVTPFVEYDSAYNQVFDPNWYLDSVVISDQAFNAGEVVDVSFMIVQPDELYNIEADFSVAYYLSDDSVVSNDDKKFDITTLVDDLPANQSAEVNVSFAAGDSFDGNYRFLAEVRSSTYGEGALIDIPVAINGNSSESSGGGGSGGGGSGSTTNPPPVTSTTTTFNDGDGTLANPANSWETFDERFDGTAGNDIINGGDGVDWFTATAGDDQYFGGSEWNQVNVLYTTFTEIEWDYDTAIDMLYSYHANLGTDQYDATVDNFWFNVDSLWQSRSNIITLIEGGENSTTPTDPFTPQAGDIVFSDGQGFAPDPAQAWQWWDESFGHVDPVSFSGDEIIFAGAGKDNIVASPGNDVIDGGAGSEDQITVYDVPLSEMAFGYPGDGTVHTYNDATGYDIQRGIEAWWFQDGGWQSEATIIGLADPDFVFV